MIISRRHAIALLREGKARVEGTVTMTPEADVPTAAGRTWRGGYVVLTRYDVQRTDHYRYSPADDARVRRAEQRETL